MRAGKLDEAGHALVSAAVARAESGTDGEIVTIIADASETYRDTALHYAVAAMLLVLAAAAIRPAALQRLVDGGWGEPDLGRLLFALLIVEAVVFLLVRYGLASLRLRATITPAGTRNRRVRRRAVALFKVGAEKRTQRRVGILVYLSLAERMAEIIADETIAAAVPAERWGEAMAAMIAEVRQGRVAEGMVQAVDRIGAILAEAVPRTPDDVNELPDRLIEL